MKHCTYGQSIAILLNWRGVTAVSFKYSVTKNKYVQTHATVDKTNEAVSMAVVL
jgi:hypothetical protein